MNDEIKAILEKFPKMKDMQNLREIFWTNDHMKKFDEESGRLKVSKDDIRKASERLQRFAPYLAKVFPETAAEGGIIESPLRDIPSMKKIMSDYFSADIKGRVMLKCDNELKISGSIKARGGIYEILKHAEDLAIENNMLSYDDNYEKLADESMREFFSRYAVAVGSTGNLGLSIGIMSAKLGFRVTVHMSADAKQWKKDMLRSKGVEVVEYESDYSKAVEEGRRLSDLDPMSYFVDDENSVNLFMGYAVAALRLEKQLKEKGISIDSQNPLFVYLPCGVGGGPGGVAFGLKTIFMENVHFFFAEPTHSPCMTMGCMTGTHDRFSVQDFGIDNITSADGLAVGRASGFVGKTLENLVSGCYTVTDENMFRLLYMMAENEHIYLEPSALAGVAGIYRMFSSEEGKTYLRSSDLEGREDSIIHVAWATGGSMVPQDIMKQYCETGKKLI